MNAAVRLQAEAYLRKAFALNPAQVETHVAWCQFRAAERDQAGAWQWLRWALARDPDHSEAVNMHGILLHNDSRFAEAVEVFERAEALGNRAAASNRGNSLLDMGRMDEALCAHENWPSNCDPQSAGAKLQPGFDPIAPGRLATRLAGVRSALALPRGSPQVQESLSSPAGRASRWKAAGCCSTPSRDWAIPSSSAAMPPWWLPAAAWPFLQVQAPVERLMRSLPVVRCGQAETALLGAKPPQFDLECPLLSLPAVFGTTIETVPWPGAYLGADPELAFQTQAQFPDFWPHPHPHLAFQRPAAACRPGLGGQSPLQGRTISGP